ncbi:MAG: TRAP transporter substrate-binding protein [Fusobacteriaceae bacterium]|jgi:tripartite ATP-independent transporter DctP family solute receptor|nr:TRAP transporter substrate-binding protein [Fusobacteriaceae bacterium]
MMKKMFTVLLTLTVLFSVTLLGSGKVALRLAHFGMQGDPGYDAAEAFKKEVEEKSGGAITIQIYPNNELGNPPEIIEQTKLGAIDASLVTQGSLDKYSKKFALLVTPFAFRSYEHAYKVQDGPFYEWTKNDLEAQNMHLVGSWDYGFRNLTNSKRPVKVPDDVKGLKIRTPPEIQQLAAMEALGANVQQISFTELVPALKQHTVDGQENPLTTIYTNKLWEVDQKYLSITHHVYQSLNLVFSKATWDKLSPEHKAIIETASKNAGQGMRDVVKNAEAKYIKLLEEKGIQTEYPDIEEFAKRMGPAYKKMAEYVGSQALLDEFLKMVEDAK